MTGRDKQPELSQELRDYQIFFIILSSLIGGGIFYNDGEALEISGPAGMLVALFVVGALAIMMMEGLSELVQLFPAPNAIFQYVRAFVDEDLAWVTGIAYWYTWVSIYAAQNLAAAQHSTYYGVPQTYRIIIFFVGMPIETTIINLFPIYVYGWVESVGGILKVSLMLGVSIMLYVLAGQDMNPNGPINDGFQHNDDYVSNDQVAECYAIPIIAYSFIGVEAVAVTAYEARTTVALKWPSQVMAYVVFLLYLLLVVGEVLNVKWNNKYLPAIYGGFGSSLPEDAPLGGPDRSGMAMIAAASAGLQAAPGVLNGCFIFALISASNSSLYIASRTLYGMALHCDGSGFVGRMFKKLSIVEPRTKCPIAAVVVSTLSFCWLPFLQVKGGNKPIGALIEIVAVSSSVSCMFVWGTICLVFIRFKYFLDKYRAAVERERPQFDRRREDYRAVTALRRLQPIPAYIGLAGSLMVLAFTSTLWWTSPATFGKVAVAYGAPIVLFTLWVVFKAWTLLTHRDDSEESQQRRWVTIDDHTALFKVLKRLSWYKRDDPPPYETGHNRRVLFRGLQASPRRQSESAEDKSAEAETRQASVARGRDVERAEVLMESNGRTPEVYVRGDG